MQRIVLVVGVLAIVLGASTQAKAFGVGADFGYSRVLVKDGPDANGFGGDLYLRPLPLPIVDPEVQLGLHRFKESNSGADTSFTIYPLLAGARLSLPVVPIFVGGHVGVIGNHVGLSAPGLGTVTQTNWDFGFNVGGGWNFLNIPLIKLGIGAWYYVIPANHNNGVNFNMFQVALDVGLGF